MNKLINLIDIISGWFPMIVALLLVVLIIYNACVNGVI